MTNGGWISPTLPRKAGARGARAAIGILSLVICHWLAEGGATAAPAGVPPRRVVYLFRDALWSAEADGSRPRPLTQGMAVYAFDLSADGGRVAFAAGTWRGARKRRELVENGVWVVNADGTELRRLTGQAKTGALGARVGHLRWSPDGRSLAFDVVGERNATPGGGTLYVVRLPEGKAHRAAPEPVASFSWTADGQITYQRTAPSSPPASGPAVPMHPSAGKATAPTPREATTAVAPPVPPAAVPQERPISPASAPSGGGAPMAGLPAARPAPPPSGAGAE